MTQDKKPVVIVGAGLAGLNCARILTSQKVPVKILEKSDGVGGRVRTDVVDGFRLDRGFQVLLSAYPEASQTFDIPSLEMSAFEPGALIRLDRGFVRLSDPWRRPSKALATVLSPAATLGDKLRIARLRKQVCRGSVTDLLNRPRTKTEDRLRELGFSSKILDRFFRPFLGGVFLERELETPSSFFEFVFRMFSEGDAVLPRDGMGALAQQLAAPLPDECLELHAEVKAVSKNQVQLANGRAVDAAAVVVAVEPSGVDQILPGFPKASMRSVTCAYYAADTAPLVEPILVLNGTGRGPINNLCVSSQVVPNLAPADQSLVSVTTLQDFSTSDDRQHALRAQLEDWYGPSARGWRLLREYEISHALPPVSDRRSETSVSHAGVWVAGDHLETPSIEGALISGRKTAEAILSEIDR